jgi:UDP-N-acetylglucosamine 4,6-dehydratase/5-epimerase
MIFNKKFFTNKNILITGGTGTFGTAMINFLLKNSNPKSIIIYSRDEMKQWYLKENLIKYKNVKFVLGDVRDKERLDSVLNEKIDYVFHAAATKIVPTSEFNPEECIKTNIIGAMNVIDCCKNNKVKRVIALSTDKASSPINLYGATKLCSDKLFVAQNRDNVSTKFGVVRYGNVVASRGSIIPYFKSLVKEQYFPITHPEMTRFFLSIEEAVKFSCFGMIKMIGGEIFVKKIKSISIIDLAKSIKTNAKFKITGIRPGEKIHEQMIGSDESMNTAEFKDHYEILANVNEKMKRIKKGSKSVPKDFIFSSKTANKFSISEFKKIIQKLN